MDTKKVQHNRLLNIAKAFDKFKETIMIAENAIVDAKLTKNNYENAVYNAKQYQKYGSLTCEEIAKREGTYFGDDPTRIRCLASRQSEVEYYAIKKHTALKAYVNAKQNVLNILNKKD
jgi:hypothetical protein